MKLKVSKKSKSIANFFAVIDKNIKELSTNKFFVGIVLICLNVASKFTSVKLSKATENFLRTGFAWQILVFCMSYMGTRCIYTSFTLTVVFILITQYFCNEESSLCILPTYFREKYQNSEDYKEPPSKAEIDKAIEIMTNLSKTITEKTPATKPTNITNFY